MIPKSTLNVYDKFAKQYCDYLDERLPQFNLTKFSTFIMKNKTKEKRSKILDFGCCGGRDVLYLMEEGFDVTGIDPSPNIIREAKKRVKKAKLKVMDLSKLDFKDNHFDGIWCFGPLKHIKKKDVDRTLKDFLRIMKEKAILFISTPEGEGENMVERKEFMGKKIFYSFYSQQELEQKLKDSGFEIMSSVIEEFDEKFVTVFARKPKAL